MGHIVYDPEREENLYASGKQMILYLDTNMVISLLTGRRSDIDRDTRALFADNANITRTSSVCVQELIHLRQIEKIFVDKKRHNYRPTVPILNMLKEANIDVVYVNDIHLRQLDELPIVHGHRDPFDRLIIAQAIADRATLVSTDRMFPNYVELGLKLHQNFK